MGKVAGELPVKSSPNTIGLPGIRPQPFNLVCTLKRDHKQSLYVHTVFWQKFIWYLVWKKNRKNTEVKIITHGPHCRTLL